MKDRHKRFWTTVNGFLRSWENEFSLGSWRPWRDVLRGREGLYVLCRGLLIGVLLSLVNISGWDSIGMIVRIVAVSVALLLVVDILLVHISVTFVSKSLSHPLRSIALAIGSFFEIAFAFAVFYLAAAASFSVPLGWPQAIYFSVVTASTLGFGDITPKQDASHVHWLVVAELAASVTFVSAIIAGLMGLANTKGAVEQ